jgi:hypothetical protein
MDRVKSHDAASSLVLLHSSDRQGRSSDLPPRPSSLDSRANTQMHRVLRKPQKSQNHTSQKNTKHRVSSEEVSDPGMCSPMPAFVVYQDRAQNSGQGCGTISETRINKATETTTVTDEDIETTSETNGEAGKNVDTRISVETETNVGSGINPELETNAGTMTDSETKANVESEKDTATGTSASVTTSCCIFCCGVIPLLTGSTYNKRKRSMRSIGQFVAARCQPTPYGYNFFSSAHGEERVLLCISCVNWQRRASGAGRKKALQTKKPMLLMDQIILFMLEPGTIQFPDQRCVSRLVTSLKTMGDGSIDWVPRLILGLMPVQVQTMIGMLPLLPTESMLNAIVRVWWEFNGRTVFFSHHLTAKLVRKMVKTCDRMRPNGPNQEDGEDMMLPESQSALALPAVSPSPCFP